MTSAEHRTTGAVPSGDRGEREAADVGLLDPVRAGSATEAATGDRAFLQAMLDAEAALARAQAALGHAPARAAAEISAAARADRFDVRDLALRGRPGGNPVIPLVSDLTAAVSCEAAPYVHRGATSQDVLDTAAMLVTARSLPDIIQDLHRTAGTLGRLAAEHRETPMAGRTLTQHAVPTTFGLKAAGWRSLVLDAADRLSALRPPAQLGGAAGTLAAFEVLACEPGSGPGLLAAFAGELGLAAPPLPWHTLRTPWPTRAGRSPSPRARSANSPRTSWCSRAPRSASWPRAAVAAPPRCRTRATPCGPR